MSTSYADSAQGRELDARLNDTGARRIADNWFEYGPDVFAERCRANEAKRVASLPGRLRAAMAQMEMICPPKTGV